MELIDDETIRLAYRKPPIFRLHVPLGQITEQHAEGLEKQSSKLLEMRSLLNQPHLAQHLGITLCEWEEIDRLASKGVWTEKEAAWIDRVYAEREVGDYYWVAKKASKL